LSPFGCLFGTVRKLEVSLGQSKIAVLPFDEIVAVGAALRYPGSLDFMILRTRFEPLKVEIE
jgi:hypothetical protein